MKPGEIILIKFPFSILESTKKRPALVLSYIRHSDGIQLVTVAMVTSQVKGLKLRGDVILSHWQKSGLLHESLVRLAKVATVEDSLIEKSLGKLSAPDHERVKKSFGDLYSVWI